MSEDLTPQQRWYRRNKQWSKDYAAKRKNQDPNYRKEYLKKYRDLNREKILANDKVYREKNKQKVLKATADWAKLNPDKISLKNHKTRERYPEKYAARQAVLVAKRSGKLVQKPCVICGLEKSEAHHEDYSKPLDVIWFCNKHHNEHHQNQK